MRRCWNPSISRGSRRKRSCGKLRTDISAAWVKKLDPADQSFEHHLLEALWTYQSLNVVEPKLLGQLLLCFPQSIQRRLLGFRRVAKVGQRLLRFVHLIGRVGQRAGGIRRRGRRTLLDLLGLVFPCNRDYHCKCMGAGDRAD